MSSITAEPTGRPLPGEYAAYLEPDLDQVGGDDAVTALETGREAVLEVFAELTDARMAGEQHRDALRAAQLERVADLAALACGCRDLDDRGARIVVDDQIVEVERRRELLAEPRDALV